MDLKLPLGKVSPDPADERDGRALTYLVLFMAVLIFATIGSSVYYIRDLHNDIRSLRKKLGDVENEYEKLVANAEQSVADIRKRLDGAADRQAKASGDKEKEAVTRLQQLAVAPNSSASGGPNFGNYGYRIIQITEKQLQGGQEVIFTRKSNLDAFFNAEEKVEILSTHHYNVWDDQFLLVVYRKS